MKLEAWKVESYLKELLAAFGAEIEVTNVEVPEKERGCMTIELSGSLTLDVLNAIGRAYGDSTILVSRGYDDDDEGLALILIPTKDPGYKYDAATIDDDYSDDDEPEPEDDGPHMDLHHADEFYDVEECVIPSTEQRRSNTEQNEQIMAWMKEVERYPLSYQRLEDGIHCEMSDTFDRKISSLLQEGFAYGKDGRRYTFDEPDRLFPVCGTICVRATCDETGRNDSYGIDFFA